MANKENLSPRPEPERFLRDGSTPPANPPTTLGIRHWQQSALNHSPPFALLSPNSRPSLARQRDHSACRKTDSPLRVRKTRENLKQASVCADVLPPCLHFNNDVPLPPDPGSALIPTLPTSNGGMHRAHFDSTSTLTADNNDYANTTSTPSTPAKVLRHKSVSRRMLSKVKEGISNRSRSSNSMRTTAGSEGGLIRRISNRRKQSAEERSRLRSFEISRDSIESQEPDVDICASQRSFTDSSISTDEFLGSASATLMTPPSATGPPAPEKQFSDRLLSPTMASRSPTSEPTPRPHSRFASLGWGNKAIDLQATIPYVDLKVSLDRDLVDVGLARDVWVAIEAFVRTKSLETSTSRTSQALRSRPLDAIVVTDHDACVDPSGVVHRCLVELFSRLDVLGDRLAVISGRKRSDDTESCWEAALLHALMIPNTALVLERLGIIPTTTRCASAGSADTCQFLPMQDLLKTFIENGLQQHAAQVFIVSTAPNSLAQSIGLLVDWPVHTIKIGLDAEDPGIIIVPALANWTLGFRGPSDVNTDLLANMFRDLRHGCSLGNVTSLRLCFKPLERCKVLEVVGQKAVKDLRLGQRCELFLKVHVPRVTMSETPAPQEDETDADSLFVELESILGTLETKFLHIEARYRHTALPTESVATVREICTIKRPKSDSRWSIVADTMSYAAQSNVHSKLAQFLAVHYVPNRALKMLDRWTLQQSGAAPNIQRVRMFLEHQATKAQVEDESWVTTTSAGSDKPSVVITDIDTTSSDPQTHDQSLPIQAHPTALLTVQDCTSQSSRLATSPSTATIISAPKTTTAVTLASSTNSNTDKDSARQLWRHLRRNSQPAQLMLEPSPEQLEASDETGMVKMLRHKALANKRSVGAETLKGWRWEGNQNQHVGMVGGEAPWL